MITNPVRARAIRGLFKLTLGFLPGGCLLDNADHADAGTQDSSGSTTSSLCVFQMSPCGGDVKGTWSVQSICALSNPVDKINANFSQYPSCAGACTSATVTASGTKTYDSGALTSSETFVLSERLSLTSACFLETMGTELNESTCQAASSQFASASCSLSVTGCTCQITASTPNDAQSYLTNGSVLTEAQAGSLQGTNLDYCVLGNTMTQRRTLPFGVDFIVTYNRR